MTSQPTTTRVDYDEIIENVFPSGIESEIYSETAATEMIKSCMDSAVQASQDRWISDIVKYIDDEILLNDEYDESPRLREGARIVKVKILSMQPPHQP